MKRLITSFFITLLIAAVSIPVVAQPQRGQRGGERQQQMRDFRDIPQNVRTEAHLVVFDEYLNLTESQEEQLKTIDIAFAERGATLRSESINRQRKMLARKDLRDAHRQAIHEILTKEQYSILLEKKEAIQYDFRQRLKAFSDNGDK